MEQLLGLYQTYAADTEGKMGLAEFSIVASSLLLMIYQNAYPDVVGTTAIYTVCYIHVPTYTYSV